MILKKLAWVLRSTKHKMDTRTSYEKANRYDIDYISHIKIWEYIPNYLHVTNIGCLLSNYTISFTDAFLLFCIVFAHYIRFVSLHCICPFICVLWFFFFCICNYSSNLKGKKINMLGWKIPCNEESNCYYGKTSPLKKKCTIGDKEGKDHPKQYGNHEPYKQRKRQL